MKRNGLQEIQPTNSAGTMFEKISEKWTVRVLHGVTFFTYVEESSGQLSSRTRALDEIAIASPHAQMQFFWCGPWTKTAANYIMTP